MKCDHLLGRMFDGEVYILASDVMEAVAEMKDKLRDHCIHCPVKMQEDDVVADLKAKLEKTIAERDGNQVCIDALKAKLENVQASMYCDVVDANMKVRMLCRALYKACANWAHHRVFVRFNANEKAWENMERKCLKKAEEYK